MKNKKLNKKSWEKPKLISFNIDKTYGGALEHSTREDVSYHPAS